MCWAGKEKNFNMLFLFAHCQWFKECIAYVITDRLLVNGG